MTEVMFSCESRGTGLGLVAAEEQEGGLLDACRQGRTLSSSKSHLFKCSSEFSVGAQ